jgi:hypothetical protein
MENNKQKKSNTDSGTAFIDQQQSSDAAKNERAKSELNTNKLNPEQANNPARRNSKTDVSRKKTGGGKQTSPGD